ncbi:16238_t:CDS:10, partial [Acaulospora colombiana]
GSNRFNELLEALKQEYENLQQEAITYKMQREEFEHKVQQQTEEVSIIRQGLYELQAAQKGIKQQYDVDIRNLQREIEQQRSNLFGTIISGNGGPQSLAPPQMSLDPAQPPNQPGHPYPGPGGPPQSVPQSGGSSAQSPYLNGGGPPGQVSQPHTTKRPRLEDGAPPSLQVPMGIPANTQSPAGLYGGNVVPLSQPGQQGPLNTGYNMPPVGQSNKLFITVTTCLKIGCGDTGQIGGPDGPQSSGVPTNGNAPLPGPPPNKRKNNQNMNTQLAGSRPPLKQGSISGTGNSGLGDMDPESVPPQLKKEGSDWFAIFNPKVSRVLDVDLVHTLDHNRDKSVVILNSSNSFIDVIKIWDIQKRTIRQFFPGHEQDIYSLDFSRDGRLIVSGSGDKTARIWDMVSGGLLYKLAIDEPSQKDAGVTSVAISPDGLYVAAGSLDKIVRVWDARTGYLLERLEGHKDSVYSVAFAPDGKTLVSGSLDKTLKLWDMSHPGRNPSSGGSSAKNPARMTFSGHKDFVLSVAVSPDGRWVVSGSKDRGVQFWDPNTAYTQFMLQGHKNSVISVALSPALNGSKLFATGSGDCRARVWRYVDDS